MREFYKNKKIVVTGGCGAIGSRLVKMLVDVGDVREIVVIDDLSSGNNIIPNNWLIKYHFDSILNRELLEKAFAGADIVFHLAANFANQNSVDHPEKDLEINTRGTFLVLETARAAGVKKVAFTSSSCVYGAQDKPLEEEGVRIDLLETPYAIHKLTGEAYCSYYHKNYGLDVTTFRIFNCYGPGERPGPYRNVIPNFIKLALEGRSLPITGTGDEERDFNYVDDVVRKILRVTALPDSVGEVFNIGSGKGTRIIDLANLINKLTNNKAGVIFKERRGWDFISKRQADISKLKKIDNFDFGYQDMELEEGIIKNIDFIKSLQS